HDTPGEAAELHALEAALAEQLRKLLGAGEAADAGREVRVRGTTRENAAEQRHDAVEPELVEERERAPRLRDLEDPEPGPGTEDTSELLDARLEVIDVADPEPDDCGIERRVLEREVQDVGLHPLDLGRLSPCTLEHPLGEVDADDFPCARLAGCDRKVARPTTGVEDAVARPD